MPRAPMRRCVICDAPVRTRRGPPPKQPRCDGCAAPPPNTVLKRLYRVVCLSCGRDYELYMTFDELLQKALTTNGQQACLTPNCGGFLNIEGGLAGTGTRKAYP